MAIFGNVYSENGTLIHETQPYDTFFNYFFGFLFLVLFLASSMCNPVIFWYHRHIKQNISAIMFQLLPISDFLTCLLVAPAMSYYLLFYNTDHAITDKVRIWQVLWSVPKICCFYLSNSLTAVIGVTRAVAILRPFVKIKRKMVVGIVVADALLIVSLFVTCVLVSPTRWNVFTQIVIDFDQQTPCIVFALAIYLINALVALTSAIASCYGLAVAHRKRSAGAVGSQASHYTERIACQTIILLNFMIFAHCLMMLAKMGAASSDDQVLKHYLEFLAFPVCNTLLSALNPVIILWRSADIRRSVVFWRLELHKKELESGQMTAISTDLKTDG